jgi:cobalt-precorrin 5A hydrolase/precorrin-3B C17-methyltransferase
MRVVSVSVTPGGRALAARLPFEAVHGGAADAVRRLWPDVDGLVLMLATGAAVRIIGPLLRDKDRDPAVVCVDEAARWAVALCGGHAGGANELARSVANLLGAEAVVTTATDAAGVPALDLLPGFAAAGDVAAVTRALLEGRNPMVEVALPGWPAPLGIASGAGPERVVVTDRRVAGGSGVVLLHPPSLVVGVGCSTGAGVDEVRPLLDAALAEAGLARASVGAVATIDRRAAHPAVSGLGLPVRAFPAPDLARVRVPNPSPVVDEAVGTPSVAEAAALLAAGRDASLVVTKRTSPTATVAVARRRRPVGELALVGLGPGHAGHRTPAAAAAVRSAEVVTGYAPYVEQAADLIRAGQVVERHPIGSEAERARGALEHAASGRRVALVCSGDAGVYAMASIVLEVAPEVAPDVEVSVVPGVTAGVAAAALLGAPLGHDHAVVSLSDLLTSWEVIAHRVRAAAESDLVLTLYNPRSAGRTWQLEAALDIVRRHRPADTPVGVVADAYRPGQQVSWTTLSGVDPATVGMTTCVIVGASSTRIVGGRMVTPRGYRPCP